MINETPEKPEPDFHELSVEYAVALADLQRLKPEYAAALARYKKARISLNFFISNNDERLNLI